MNYSFSELKFSNNNCSNLKKGLKLSNDVFLKNGYINGEKIINIWKNNNGWYWFATEISYTQKSIIKKEIVKKDIIFFGFVIGIVKEWGYFSKSELKSLSPKVLEVKI